MKRELQMFWDDFREVYLHNVLIFGVFVVAIVAVIFWVTLPVMLSIWCSPWFLLLYIVIVPAIFTALACLAGIEGGD